MPDGARVVLHVGAPKAGSTYLQRRLRIAPEALGAHGLRYPVLPGWERVAGNAKCLAVALDRHAKPQLLRTYPQLNAAELDAARLAADLVAGFAAGDTVLLSGENLRPRHAAPIRELLPPDREVRVVLVVRRQDDWYRSFFSQRTKTWRNRLGMSAFLDCMLDERPAFEFYPDWLDHYHAWGRHFDCRVVFYDESDGSLFDRFLEAAGLDPLPGYPDIERQNTGLEVFELAYLLACPDDADPRQVRRHRLACREAARSLRHRPSGPMTLLSVEDRRRLISRFASSNASLLERVGRAGEHHLLAIDAESPHYVELDDVYRSPAYEEFCELVDAVGRFRISRLGRALRRVMPGDR